MLSLLICLLFGKVKRQDWKDRTYVKAKKKATIYVALYLISFGIDPRSLCCFPFVGQWPFQFGMLLSTPLLKKVLQSPGKISLIPSSCMPLCSHNQCSAQLLLRHTIRSTCNMSQAWPCIPLFSLCLHVSLILGEASIDGPVTGISWISS